MKELVILDIYTLTYVMNVSYLLALFPVSPQKVSVVKLGRWVSDSSRVSEKDVENL